MKRVRELPVGEEKARVVRSMFDRIAGRYDLVNRVMTFGLDVGWRSRTVSELSLPRGSVVLDLACGTGDLCRELERARHRVIGVDFSMGMLRAAKTREPLVQADILSLPMRDDSADGVTCGFALRNVTDLQRLFAEMARVVRPGGRLSLLEVSQPRQPLMRLGHAFYINKVVPRIGGLLSDRSAYEYLPASVSYLPADVELLSMLRSAGFADVYRIALSGGIAQLIAGTRSA